MARFITAGLVRAPARESAAGIIAPGGVDPADIIRLRKAQAECPRLEGLVIGRALYDGGPGPVRALAAARGEAPAPGPGPGPGSARESAAGIIAPDGVDPADITRLREAQAECPRPGGL